ncbi:unnamed protein product, partial [Didymodactylos carnosus]
DSTFSALQYLGRDLKKSLDLSSSTDIDRELKDVASSVETVRDSLDRAKRTYEENEALRERIERILNKAKLFANRKRQELQQSTDSGYVSVDLMRRSVEIKSFIKDVDIETSGLSELSDLIVTLSERKYDSQIVRSLEKKHEDALHDLKLLRMETIKTVENIDQQTQEQEKLRQNARSILSLLQRAKVNLIELRPTINDEANQKLKKVDNDLTTTLDEFQIAWENYRHEYEYVSDDLEKLVSRVGEDMNDVKTRYTEKEAELNSYRTLNNEYEICVEKILVIMRLIENKTKNPSTNVKESLHILKELEVEMQGYRPMIDRLQLLSSTLSSQLTDPNERDRI